MGWYDICTKLMSALTICATSLTRMAEWKAKVLPIWTPRKIIGLVKKFVVNNQDVVER